MQKSGMRPRETFRLTAQYLLGEALLNARIAQQDVGINGGKLNRLQP